MTVHQIGAYLGLTLLTTAAMASDDCQFRTDAYERAETQRVTAERAMRAACPWSWSKWISEDCSAKMSGYEVVAIITKMTKQAYDKACFGRSAE